MDTLFKIDTALSSSRPAVTFRRLLQSSLRFLRSLKDPSVRRELRGTEPLQNLVPNPLIYFVMISLFCIAAVPVVFLGLFGLLYVFVRPELWLWFLLGVPAVFLTLFVVLCIYTAVEEFLANRSSVPMVEPLPGPDQPHYLCGSEPGGDLP